MPLIEDAIFAHLSAHAGLTALVGAGNNARIYPGRLLQGSALPAVVYNVVNKRGHAKAGAATGRAEAAYQFDCIASSRDAAAAVREQVRLAMIAMSGSIAGMTVQRSMQVSQVDHPHDPVADIFHLGLDFAVWYKEPIS